MQAMNLNPPLLLRSPHMQTLLSSRMARGLNGAGTALLRRATTVTIPCRDGIRLQAEVNADHPGAPLVIVIHGWLGRADSPYVCRAADALYGAGFNVARLLLRDHGGTAALNLELFNAARIDEVVDACRYLAGNYGAAGTGLMGFSLGGNFVLRVLVHPERGLDFGASLAVCPVLDPSASADALDSGWAAYRAYFVSNWQAAFTEKQAAFPEHYDFSALRRLKSVAELTDVLVERYTPYANATEYYSHYTLGAEMLASIDLDVRVISAVDDPVIPVGTLGPLQALPASSFDLSPRGGHCAFIKDYRLRSALGDYAVNVFQRLR